MDLSTGALVGSLIVSTVGFALFIYGKKQVRLPQLFVGLVMMAYPYFVSGPLAMWGIASALVVTLTVLIRSGL